jgi:TP901 family phage tail tape measure protein
MADVANLGFDVESRKLAEAEHRLDEIAAAAKKAENATVGFSDRANRAANKIAAANDNAARAASRVVSSYKALIPLAVRLGGVLGAIGGVAISADVRGARDLSASLAEVSTLLGGTEDDLQRIQNAARDMGREFGTTAASQVKSFYQAISAGATDVATATALLESANRVAIGGITDTTTAVDVLTTATNAYAAAGLSAAEASDALFVGMRAGKTTISEMASTLGNVIPIAASLGVTFDELVAGVAALTTQGQSTAQAVTGVRAILSQIAKPTSEATKLSKQLGLEFNTTSLQAKGLSGFLGDVITKTGGNADALAKLFGSVEALNAVLSFAGGGGAAFTNILGDMESKAGAADAAYRKVADSLDKRLGVALNRIADVSVRIGEALLTVIVPAAEAFATALETVADNAADLAIVLAPIAAIHLAKMVAGFASLAAGMNVAAVAARGLSVAMAFIGGPIGLALTALAAGFVLLKNNVSEAGRAARDADSAYQANKSAIEAARTSSDGYTTSLRNQIAMQVEVAKTAYASADAAFYSALKMREAFRAMTGLKFAPLEYMTDARAAEADQMGALVAKLQAQLAEVDANMKKAQNTDTPPGTTPGLPGLGGSAEANPYDAIVRGARQFIEAQKLEAQALSMTEEAAARLRHQQDLLNRAANDNIALTPKQTEELSNLAAQMAAAEVATNRAKEAMTFSKNAVNGFFSDLRSGLEQGKSAWAAFGDVALNVLNKILDKIQNDLVNAIFDANGALGGLGGGGLFGGLIGGIGKIFGFAKGGYTGNGPASAVAGVVHGGEYVFSKRATDRIGVRNLEAMHRSAKGYASGGYVAPVIPAANANQPAPVVVNMPINIDATGADAAELARVKAEIRSMKETLPKQVTSIVGQQRSRSVV